MTSTSTTTAMTPKKAAEARLLQALAHHGIKASPRTLETWLETAENLCMALATFYRDAEPTAFRAIAALEEAATEFNLMSM